MLWVSWEDRAVAPGIGAPVNICLASGGNQAAVSASPSPIIQALQAFWAFASLFLPSLVMLWSLRKAREITESNSQLRGCYGIHTEQCSEGMITNVRFSTECVM